MSTAETRAEVLRLIAMVPKLGADVVADSIILSLGPRCERTGNPCGTDTWMVGHSCPCFAYQRYLATEPPQPASAGPEVEPGDLDAVIRSLTEHIDGGLTPGAPMLRFWRSHLRSLARAVPVSAPMNGQT